MGFMCQVRIPWRRRAPVRRTVFDFQISTDRDSQTVERFVIHSGVWKVHKSDQNPVSFQLFLDVPMSTAFVDSPTQNWLRWVTL